MCNIVSHKLYLLSRIRKFLTVQACINIFKTMVLSVIVYGDIIYAGTSSGNLNKLDRLFSRGLRICLGYENVFTKDELCAECKISILSKRRDLHLLLYIYMHKQSSNPDLLKPRLMNTRLYMAPVFMQYKPSNEKARMSTCYIEEHFYEIIYLQIKEIWNLKILEYG